MPCLKLKENLKKRKEKIKTVIMKEIKTNPYQSDTEELKVKWMDKIMKEISFLKREFRLIC